MKQLFKCIFVVFSLFAFSIPQPAKAQTQITHQVISGGGTTMANGSYRLQGTVGQATIGSSTNSSHALHSGFWARAEVTVTSVEQIEDNIMPESFRLDQNYPTHLTRQPPFSLPYRSARKSC